MRRLVLGTAGHIDHGKTTLVNALTGTDTDRLIEEKRRGITIDIGFASLQLRDDLNLAIVDLPGHDAFIRNMLAGATGIDLALLVIAADEGVMPQTREHLAILELLGVRAGVVAISKIDLVEPEWLELVIEETAEVLVESPLIRQPPVPVSTRTGEGLEQLRDALQVEAASVVTREHDDLFRLPVDRVFPVHGTGTVVTGTVWSGSVERDQELRLLPTGRPARIRSIQVHGEDVERASAGQRAALALIGIERQRIGRGDTLVSDDAWKPAMILTAELNLLHTAPAPIANRTRIRFHLGTSEVMARVVLLEGDRIEPGADALVQFRLEGPIAARAGDRFVIRSYSPVTTIGGGVIIEPSSMKRSRIRVDEANALRMRVSGNIRAALTSLVVSSGWKGIELQEIPLLISATIPEIWAEIEDQRKLQGAELILIGDRLFHHEIIAQARERFLQTIAAYHQSHPLGSGISREELRRTLPPTAPPELAGWALEMLIEEGTIEGRGPVMVEAGYRPRLDETDRRISEQIVQILEKEGLTPPQLTALPPDIGGYHNLRELLRILEEDERIVAVTPDLYLTRSRLTEAIIETYRLLADRDTLGTPDFREALPISRKYLIPLLEYFDQMGFTKRVGDQRTIVSTPEQVLEIHGVQQH